ncbi:MAG TPA: hypothetical protein VGD67_02020 [Pseudonocardiaceae bacterium]
MTDDPPPPGPSAVYLAELLAAARAAITEGLAAWGGGLEHMQVDDTHLTATVHFRGTRYSFRRRVWPPDHPPGLKASLLATSIEERLLTGRHPPPDPSGAAVPL